MASLFEVPAAYQGAAAHSLSRRPAASGRLLAGALLALALTGSGCAAERTRESCSESLRTLFDRASPAVVRITGQAINPYRRDDRVSRRLGSGFLIDQRGLILTNSHVVFGLQTVTVTLDDGTNLRARLVGADPIFDLALIQIPVRDGAKLPTLELGDSDALRPGDEVIAIGNPLGLDQTITRGIVSGLNRQLGDAPLPVMEPLIQTDAAINPGNSGGPLLDRCGEAIGVNTAVMSDANNIGFAIPSNLARSVIESLVKDGHVVRPWVGFHGQLVSEDVRKLLRTPMVDGLLIEVVEPGSPAEKAQIQGGDIEVSVGEESLLLGGDIVVSIDGTSVDTPEHLLSAMSKLKVGSHLQLKLFRDGHYREVSYTLPERPLLPGDIPDGDVYTPIPAGTCQGPRTARPGHTSCVGGVSGRARSGGR